MSIGATLYYDTCIVRQNSKRYEAYSIITRDSHFRLSLTELQEIDTMSQEDLDELVDKKIFNEIPADEPWQLDLGSQGSFFPCNIRQLTADTVVKYSHNKTGNL